ncbi:hypothetical protein CIPAW_04G068900 [Carya illinoinensis]|uniref:Uncharacterized protein n=1 Tax=Carya illinoinensis TaxID=32201 RepID=A0A8T1QT21_CARIL|nr:hypothetical protein CIPAW_04G068900 [Carya illinoinensis]
MAPTHACKSFVWRNLNFQLKEAAITSLVK